jgi:hypothetical protein
MVRGASGGRCAYRGLVYKTNSVPHSGGGVSEWFGAAAGGPCVYRGLVYKTNSLRTAAVERFGMVWGRRRAALALIGNLFTKRTRSARRRWRGSEWFGAAAGGPCTIRKPFTKRTRSHAPGLCAFRNFYKTNSLRAANSQALLIFLTPRPSALVFPGSIYSVVNEHWPREQPGKSCGRRFAPASTMSQKFAY